MSCKQWFRLLALVMVLAAATPVRASDTYEPPAQKEQSWHGVLQRGKILVDVSLHSDSSGKCTANIKATGLDPGRTYSFWLADNSGKLRGLVSTAHQVKSDSQGKLVYAPTLDSCPTGASLKLVVEKDVSARKRVKVVEGFVSQQP